MLSIALCGELALNTNISCFPVGIAGMMASATTATLAPARTLAAARVAITSGTFLALGLGCSGCC
jgi:hypothetical protein